MIADSVAKGEACFVAMAEFDTNWGKQTSPDPKLPPQTHLVKARIEADYKSHVSSSQIVARKSKAFPLFFYVDEKVITLGKGNGVEHYHYVQFQVLQDEYDVVE